MKNLNEELNRAYSQYENIISEGLIKKSFHFSERSDSLEIIPEQSFQTILRPLFGKNGITKNIIGDHPDFENLKGTSQIVNNAITSLFIDFVGSTRLNLLYSLADVRVIKNAFICAAIEIIKTFDGHVHRIMGDAVMAFFGGKHISRELSIINAINCSSLLLHLSDVIVKPRLSDSGMDDDFGIRIGFDWGDDDKVIWSSYGYLGIEEVTATSYYVDIASKLQQNAGKNQALFGDSLKSFIDFPDKLYSYKTRTNSGISETELYVRPNHSDKQGNPMNYKKYVLDSKSYLELTDAVPTNELNDLDVRIYLYDITKNNFIERYYPCSKMLPKEHSLKFQVHHPNEIDPPFEYQFTVENHGKEAYDKGGENYGNHNHIEKFITKIDSYEKTTYWDVSAYRGLHYMTVELRKNGTKIKERKLGIFIE